MASINHILTSDRERQGGYFCNVIIHYILTLLVFKHIVLLIINFTANVIACTLFKEEIMETK